MTTCKGCNTTKPDEETVGWILYDNTQVADTFMPKWRRVRQVFCSAACSSSHFREAAETALEAFMFRETSSDEAFGRYNAAFRAVWT